MTAVVLGVALLAVLVLFAVRERAHDAERRELTDRIQAPEAAHAAAFSRAIPETPPRHDTDAEDDRIFGRDITAELDTDWMLVGEDE